MIVIITFNINETPIVKLYAIFTYELVSCVFGNISKVNPANNVDTIAILEYESRDTVCVDSYSLCLRTCVPVPNIVLGSSSIL